MKLTRTKVTLPRLAAWRKLNPILRGSLDWDSFEMGWSAAGEALVAMEARKDAAYLERNRCVALLARMALALGCRAGVARTAIEGWSEDWHGCVYVDLPTGQASWHFHDSQAELFSGLPAYPGTWDGHSAETKYERVAGAFQPPNAQAEPRTRP